MDARAVGAMILVCGVLASAEESSYQVLRSGAGFRRASNWRASSPALSKSLERSLGCKFVEAWSERSLKEAKSDDHLLVCGYFPAAEPYSSRAVFDGAQLNSRVTDSDDICASIANLLETLDEHPGKLKRVSRKFRPTYIPGCTEFVASMRWIRSAEEGGASATVRAVFEHGHCFFAVAIDLGNSGRIARVLNSMIDSFRLPI